MRFGLIVGPVYPGRDELASLDAFDYHIQMCQAADRHGFDAVSVNHHYLVGPEAQCFQPLVMAAYILGQFPRLTVATTVFLIPYHHPIEVAEQVASLDMMGPGRFVFGIGAGYRDIEFDSLGIEKSTRARRVRESIQALRQLWSNQPASFSGEFYNFSDADIGITPSNGVGPPILVAADKVRTAERVPELGADHWLPSARHSKPFLRKAVPAYKAALEGVGRTFEGLPLQRDIAVAESRSAAEDLIRDTFERMLHMQHGWGQPGEKYDVDFDELKRERVIAGPPTDCAEELIQLNQEFGADYIWFRVYTPGMELKRALEVIQLIGEEVIPSVKKELGSTSVLDRQTVDLQPVG